MDPRPPLSLLEQRRHRFLNTVHTWLLAGGSLLLLALTAYVFGGPAGVAGALLFGTITMIAVRRISPQLVLRMYKAEPVTRADFPLGVDLVEQIARRAELPAAPRLHIVPSRMMNAFAVGRRDDSAIALTDALARRLQPRELAGVLAHEISHIAHEDLKVMSFADMVARYTSLMSTAGIFMLLFNLLGFAGGYGPQVPWIGVMILLVSPTVGGLLQLALSRTREFDADLGAVLLTGDPDGLASALMKLERAQGRMWEGMVLPGGRIPDPSLLRSHPATAERVRRLMRLKAGTPALAPDLSDAVLAERAPRRRGSIVPAIRRRDDEIARIAMQIAERPQRAMPAADLGGSPYAGGNEPADPPRLRPGRGGVWW